MNYKELIEKIRKKDGCNCECLQAANAIENLIEERDAALRAQQTPLDRSRWEGCEYCAQQNVELCPMLSHDESDCDRGMYIHDGCLISNSGEFQYAKIKFCPMCGRPLSEEAWAELERRINGGTTDNE